MPASPSPSLPRVLYWFRTDLRLHDSPALTAALDLKPAILYPCWLWDPHYVYRARVGPNRWQYLLDSMSDLSQSLTKLNPKQKLLVVREAPQTGIPKLLKEWKITHLVFEKDTDAYARARDEVVIKAAKEMGVEVVVRSGRTLWDSDELVKANGGKPTMSITQVQHVRYRVCSSRYYERNIDMFIPSDTIRVLHNIGSTKIRSSSTSTTSTNISVRSRRH